MFEVFVVVLFTAIVLWCWLSIQLLLIFLFSFLAARLYGKFFFIQCWDDGDRQVSIGRW